MCRIYDFFARKVCFGVVVASVFALLGTSNASAYVENYHIEIERKDTTSALILSSIQTGRPIIFYNFPKPDSDNAHSPWILRTQNFLARYINSFSDKAIIIDFKKIITPSDSDYFSTISAEVDSSNVALFVPSQISNIDSIYRSSFASSGISFDNYWDAFFEAKMTLEEILGPTNFDYRKYIRRRSSFLPYNNAVKEGKKIIFVHYEAIYPLSRDIDKYIEAFRNVAGTKAYVLPIKTISGYYEDPAVEALSNCSDSLFCIYNTQTNKAYPLIGISEEMTKEDFNDWSEKVR